MPPNDKKTKIEESDGSITYQDLQVILDVNKKAIEINIEVEKQNEQVIAKLENFEEKLNLISQNINNIILDNKKVENFKLIKDKVDEMEKNIFRLVIILGSISITTVIAIIQLLLHK